MNEAAHEEPHRREEDREGTFDHAIHVSWNGASEVSDLRMYFRKTEELQREINFMRDLQRKLAEEPR
jgi:hypothetical protein